MGTGFPNEGPEIEAIQDLRDEMTELQPAPRPWEVRLGTTEVCRALSAVGLHFSCRGSVLECSVLDHESAEFIRELSESLQTVTLSLGEISAEESRGSFRG